MKLFSKSILFGLIITILVSTLSFDVECKQISDELLRIHILANSNSEQDQKLKLKVRDRLLKESDLIFENAKNKTEAKQFASKKIELITKIAEDEIQKNGYDYNVKAEIVNMYFDTRYYENLTTPAGFYDALRITIGSGSGKNWWCVMFPPVCIASAEEQVELKDVLSDDQQDILENSQKYEYKFKIVEIYESVANWLSQN